jgi:hypothetical protein
MRELLSAGMLEAKQALDEAGGRPVKRRGVALVVLVICAQLAGTARQAAAAFPGTNGRIVFDDTWSHNIYTVMPDGTGLKQLTTDGASVTPRWSPNGKLVAFSRKGALWVIQADGSHQHRVGAVTRAYQPTWSADGTTLAYVHVPKGTPGDIWTVPVAGGTPKRITHDATTSCGDAHPVFSPRGGSIAYDQVRGGCSIAVDKVVYTQNLSTSARHLISNAWNPDYLAAGRGLIFTGDREPDGTNFPYNLYASNLRGGFAQRVRLSDALCVEGEPCFNEGAAAPSSTLASPQAIWIETLESGEYCIESNVPGAGFCKPDSSAFLPENLDWRP